MPDQTIHELCSVHSGVESRQSSIIWLLGFLIGLIIAIGGGQITLLYNLKAEVAGFNYRFTAAEENDRAIRDKILIIDQRLQALESRAYGKKIN